ncbi:hypothetical protein [Rugosimonospora africana]|uniref:Uncharacterized protein n=1 Tax=Rugosimonospora africana TaxID=556532 RepID=A0A8J3QYC6_9ACTN|nr:hypothetical protein [Rugosimonospora africana]GIH18397.1 hypothetical protein Raf01_65690 [Rugosimonospora africana]
MRVFIGVLGGLLLLVTLGSVLRNMVVPRGLGSLLTRVVWHVVRIVMSAVARPFHSYETRDWLLAWLAPLVLVGVLASWLTSVFCAYALMVHAISALGWAESFREAGSSLFTLGFASGARSQLNALDFVAAATGPLIIALQIAYLPTLYDAYNRRETEVTLLQARAAEPAWGPELLARQALIGTLDQLEGLYQSWERLAADIGESHANYPVLLAFRSPRPYRSWIIALLAVMDAAAMQMALTPTTSPAPAARLMLRSGFTALRDIARVIRIPFDPDPLPDSPIRLTFEEFAEAVRHVEEAGLRSERSPEEAWPHFRGWRVNYEQIVYALARRVDAVPAPWSGDRDWTSQPMSPLRPLDRRPDKPMEGRPDSTLKRRSA